MPGLSKGSNPLNAYNHTPDARRPPLLLKLMPPRADTPSDETLFNTHDVLPQRDRLDTGLRELCCQ